MWWMCKPFYVSAFSAHSAVIRRRIGTLCWLKACTSSKAHGFHFNSIRSEKRTNCLNHLHGAGIVTMNAERMHVEIDLRAIGCNDLAFLSHFQGTFGNPVGV